MLNRYLLLLWLGLPSLLMVVLSLPSLAIGLMLTSVLLAAACLLRSGFSMRTLLSIRIRSIFLIFLVFAALSSFTSYIFFDQPLSGKQAFSLLAFFVLSICTCIVFKYFFSMSAQELGKNINFTFKAMLLIGAVGALSPLRFGPYMDMNHPVMPFAEPSHYALAFMQVAALLIPLSRQRKRYTIVALGLLLSLAFPNTTLLIASLLLLILIASAVQLAVVGAVAVPAIAALALFSETLLGYFTERLTNEGSENISRLVYLQGWEALQSAMSMTSGFGIGFQNLGNEPPGDAAYVLSLMSLNDLNRSDGSFLFAKAVGEFGFFGLLICGALLLFSVYCGYRARCALRKHLRARRLPQWLPACSVYIFIVEMLIRGPGYFSPSLLLSMYLLPMAMNTARNYHR